MKIVYGFAVLIAITIDTGDSRFSAADSGGNLKPGLIHLKDGEKKVSRPISDQSNTATVKSESPVTYPQSAAGSRWSFILISSLV